VTCDWLEPTDLDIVRVQTSWMFLVVLVEIRLLKQEIADTVTQPGDLTMLSISQVQPFYRQYKARFT